MQQTMKTPFCMMASIATVYLKYCKCTSPKVWHLMVFHLRLLKERRIHHKGRQSVIKWNRGMYM